MAYADQYVVYNYWDYNYAVGDVLATDDADWADTVKRNKEHLNLQLAKPEFYAGYDLKPLQDAVA